MGVASTQSASPNETFLRETTVGTIRKPEAISKLAKLTATTLSLPASTLNIGGQQYNTLAALTLNTATVGVGGVDATLVAGSLYTVYAVISGSQVYLIASLSSSLPSGFTQARTIGGFTTDASSQIDQVGEYPGNLAVAGSVSAGGGLSVQPAQNFFINGGLDFWQRGITSSSASWTYLTADRFITGNEGSTPVTAQYLDSPNANTKWCLRFTGNFAATNRVSFQQRIESSNAQYLVGKTITASFWYKITAPNLDATTANMTSIFLDIANTTDNYTGTTNYGFQPLNIVADGTWRRASYVFTIPTSYSGAALANGFSVYIRLRKNATVSTDAWDVRFAQLMLNIGTSAAPFQRAGGTIGGELALCQRYFEKSFNTGLTPGSSDPGTVFSSSITWSNNQTYITVPYKVTKRGNATTQAYDASGNAGSVTWHRNGVSQASFSYTHAAAYAGENAFVVVITGTTAGDRIEAYLHWTSDAEL